MTMVEREHTPMPREFLPSLVLLVCGLAQGVLLADLIGALSWLALPEGLWLMLHLCSGFLACLGGIRLLGVARQERGFMVLVLGLVTLVPVMGPTIAMAALAVGAHHARLRNRDPAHWIITRRAELPFTTPSDRKMTKIDGRGFEEHLMYSGDSDDLYRKVLSAAHIPSSLSISAFKTAMRHKDERIRLTAYNLLDRKVTDLNRQIQHLERQVSDGDSQQMSNTWMQIASNYWELLTLEKAEPVARRQLLEKASQAAIQSIVALPINRNAHFLLGRVSVLQGDIRRAEVAFRKAKALGMPADKVLPYLAEVAFMRQDFAAVRQILNRLDPAVRSYPPLSHVAEYWA